jgi:hypothetical protein
MTINLDQVFDKLKELSFVVFVLSIVVLGD